ncbi:MAG: hypothetical protein Q4D98_04740 [Planctomycetia bacterium]|nr:hypothetical protein [Planctomycetia bacterium]
MFHPPFEEVLKVKIQIRAIHVVLLLAAFVGTGIFSGLMVGKCLQGNTQSAIPTAQAACDRIDGYITLTMPVDGASEAVVVIDSTTGMLSAGVLSKMPNSGFQSRFQGNLNADLQKAITYFNNKAAKMTRKSSKKKGAQPLIQMPQEPKYIVTSGAESIVGRTTEVRPSVGALYVTEVNTGIMLVYILPWNQAMFSSNTPYAAPLTYYHIDRFVVPMVVEESVDEE